ncbi:MAG: methyltransferase domain-containing protein [Isosphaeraceae bacterium]|nr:methyltransferase domain-containing protein [Isosphaeraceae bacterium]
MPDRLDLHHMYDVDYPKVGQDGVATDDPRERSRVVDWLRRLGDGVFVDFGCGEGGLLVEAAKLGWRVAGVELNPAFADSVASRTREMVVSDPDLLTGMGLAPADVVHLGDVVEHLTDLDRQMPAIVRLVKPGGLLLSQGPLEASPNLFTAMLRLVRRLRPRPIVSPPYHVLLATAEGQRDFFRRFDLEEVEYAVCEVAWPAPSRLAIADLARPRLVALFLIRRLSQAISSLFPNGMGNRYFFVGRRSTDTGASGSEELAIALEQTA